MNKHIAKGMVGICLLAAAASAWAKEPKHERPKDLAHKRPPIRILLPDGTSHRPTPGSPDRLTPFLSPGPSGTTPAQIRRQ